MCERKKRGGVGGRDREKGRRESHRNTKEQTPTTRGAPFIPVHLFILSTQISFSSSIQLQTPNKNTTPPPPPNLHPAHNQQYNEEARGAGQGGTGVEERGGATIGTLKRKGAWLQ